MSFLQIKQGRAWVRLDRLTHQALAECYAEYPRPTPVSTSQFARHETKLTDWKLARITLADSRINDGRAPENAFELNHFGLAWAKVLPPLSRDRRTMPPLFPLADVLAELPQPIRDWLAGPPPIAKMPGGIMFETLGVLLPAPRGDGLIPSNELLLAFDELARRNQAGRSFTPETQVTVEYDADLCAFLSQTTVLPGVAWKSSSMDGRQLRPFNMTEDGAGMIQLIDDNGVQYWRCSYEMRAVTSALASGERDGFALARLCPQRFQDWLASGLSDVLRPAKHCRLLAVLGLIRRKGKFDWKLTAAGERVMPLLAAAIRAEATGEIAPDDSTYDGSGVDITLPDDVDDIAVEMTMDLSLDTEFAEHSSIIEAPTPPFTKDGGGYRIVPDISATDDEFDIL
jgi:hypothetical protein